MILDYKIGERQEKRWELLKIRNIWEIHRDGSVQFVKESFEDLHLTGEFENLLTAGEEKY